MADWRRVAKALALGDGKIDRKEVAILRKEMFADGRIDRSEWQFLLELKAGAKEAVQDLDKLIADAKDNIDG